VGSRSLEAAGMREYVISQESGRPPPHLVARFALLLSLALGALGLVACDDDDEPATAETEVTTSDFGKGAPGRGPVAVAGGPDACGAFRDRGRGGYRIRIDVVEGVVRCRETRRVLKNHYNDPDRNTPLWSCTEEGDRLVKCVRPGVAFVGQIYCRVWTDKGLCLRRYGQP
jgi:hypothetical protein